MTRLIDDHFNLLYFSIIYRFYSVRYFVEGEQLVIHVTTRSGYISGMVPYTVITISYHSFKYPHRKMSMIVTVVLWYEG